MYILSGRPNECWLHTCDACVITTWRLRLQAPLVTRKNLNITENITYHKVGMGPFRNSSNVKCVFLVLVEILP